MCVQVAARVRGSWETERPRQTGQPPRGVCLPRSIIALVPAVLGHDAQVYPEETLSRRAQERLTQQP